MSWECNVSNKKGQLRMKQIAHGQPLYSVSWAPDDGSCTPEDSFAHIQAGDMSMGCMLGQSMRTPLEAA